MAPVLRRLREVIWELFQGKAWGTWGLAETIMTNLSPVLEGATEVFFTMDVERSDVAEQGDRPDDRFEFRFKAERSEVDYITVKMYDRYTFLHVKNHSNIYPK